MSSAGNSGQGCSALTSDLHRVYRGINSRTAVPSLSSTRASPRNTSTDNVAGSQSVDRTYTRQSQTPSCRSVTNHSAFYARHRTVSSRFRPVCGSPASPERLGRPPYGHSRGVKSQSSYRPGNGTAASVYSEQSMRYVAEQLAVEEARRRKELASRHDHRVDRKYLVDGSGFAEDACSRSRSAILPRKSLRPLLNCRLELVGRPKAKLSLVVNGCGHINRGRVFTERKAAKKEADRKTLRCQTAEPDITCPSGVTPSKDKVVHTVSFTLPSEDSAAE